MLSRLREVVTLHCYTISPVHFWDRWGYPMMLIDRPIISPTGRRSYGSKRDIPLHPISRPGCVPIWNHKEVQRRRWRTCSCRIRYKRVCDYNDWVPHSLGEERKWPTNKQIQAHSGHHYSVIADILDISFAIRYCCVRQYSEYSPVSIYGHCVWLPRDVLWYYYRKCLCSILISYSPNYLLINLF